MLILGIGIGLLFTVATVAIMVVLSQMSSDDENEHYSIQGYADAAYATSESYVTDAIFMVSVKKSLQTFCMPAQSVSL